MKATFCTNTVMNAHARIVLDGAFLVSGEHAFMQLTQDYTHVCGLDAGGDAWCWGYGANCELGSGRAFNAAVSASHLADHYHAFFERNDPSRIAKFKTIGAFVEHISRCTHGAFRDIRSISNAYKHLYTSTDPNAARYSTISSAGSVESIDVSDAEGDVAEIGNMVGCDAHGPKFETVMYRRKDGEWREFLPALKAVMDYWEGVFN